MRKIFRLIPVVLCLSFLLSSCSKNSEHTRYISKDAIGVLSINTLELGKKVAWSALSGSPMFQEMTAEAGGDTTKFDIDKTGVEPMTTFFAYAVPDQKLNSKSRMMLIIPLKDAKKFAAFVKEKFPEAKFEKKGDLEFAYLNENTSIGWDEKTAIAAVGSPSYKDQYDENGMIKPQASNTGLLTEAIQKTFALPKDQSLAENDKFKDIMKEAHDISFFLNYEALATSMPQEELGTAGSVMASQKKLLKDAYLTGSIDFEKGKIVGEASYYFNPTMKAIAEAMEVKSVNNDLLGKVPGKQMNLMMSYHFNPQGFRALADTMGMAPLVNMGLKEVGLTFDDVLNAFTGDILLAVTDFAVTTQSKSYAMGGSDVSYTSPVPSFKASLSFKIKDKVAFDKLMKIAVDEEMAMSTTPGVYTVANYATIATNNEYVVISNEAETANAFLNNTTKSDWKIPGDVTNNPYGFYVDIKNSISAVPLDLLYGKEDTAVFHDGKKLMESISAYGGKVKGDRSTFHFEAAFQNKDENSLVQLINFSQKVAAAEKKSNDSFDEVIPEEEDIEEMADTTVPAM